MLFTVRGENTENTFPAGKLYTAIKTGKLFGGFSCRGIIGK
jgi:hypothetical protein